MKEILISEDDVIALSQKEEDQFFDRKALKISGKKIQKVVVAFANTDGGEVLIGIADDKDEFIVDKRWQGAKSVEDLNPFIQALHELEPSPPVKLEILNCEDFPGKVLKISVEKGTEVYKTADKTVYVRQGAQSLPIASPEKIMNLAFAKGTRSYEDHFVDSEPEIITDSETMQRFIEGALPKVHPVDYVINENLVDSKTLNPRAGGILLFSDNPAAVFPKKCSVKIVRYETKEDDPEREHLSENIVVEGPLYDLIKTTAVKVKEMMSSVTIWTAEGVMKSVEYPQETLWEVIVNAIIHRDYSISDDVQIKIFDNRIEVWSPGKLPAGINIDNILDSRYSRNPKIVRNLHRYVDPPNKDLGEGLNTAFQKMQEWKLKPPVLEEEGNYFKVTLPHAPLARPTELIMDFLKNHSEITNKQARDLTGIRSENLVKQEFYKLRDKDLIEMDPDKKGPASAWRLTSKGKRQASIR